MFGRLITALFVIAGSAVFAQGTSEPHLRVKAKTHAAAQPSI